MEKLLTREVVIEVMNNVLEFEDDTLNRYQDYLDRLVDEDTIKVFKRLRDEEARHVESIKGLIKKLG